MKSGKKELTSTSKHKKTLSLKVIMTESLQALQMKIMVIFLPDGVVFSVGVQMMMQNHLSIKNGR